MRWKPRWWRWFVFFLNKDGKGSQVCENLHFSTFSIYVMAGLLTVAHKRHYRGMVSHKRLYHTSINKLSPKICFAVVDGQNIMRSQEGNLVETECNWWQNIFAAKHFNIRACLCCIRGHNWRTAFPSGPLSLAFGVMACQLSFYHFHFPKGRSWTSPKKHSAVCCVDSHHY